MVMWINRRLGAWSVFFLFLFFYSSFIYAECSTQRIFDKDGRYDGCEITVNGHSRQIGLHQLQEWACNEYCRNQLRYGDDQEEADDEEEDYEVVVHPINESQDVGSSLSRVASSGFRM